MRDRIQIRKAGPKRWTVKVPTIGFGQPEVTERSTHRQALRYADQRIPRYSSNVAVAESNWQASDRVNVTPAWSPLEPVECERRSR